MQFTITLSNANNYKVIDGYEIYDQSQLEAFLTASPGTHVFSYNGTKWLMDGAETDEDYGIMFVENYDYSSDESAINNNRYDTITIQGGASDMAANTAAQATMGTYLMYKATTSATTYTKLLDIKNFPDLGGEPERVDVTTLSDRVRKYVMGVQDLSSFSFNCNYIAADYQKVVALTGNQTDFAIWIGDSESNGVYTPTGSDGQWAFKGDVMAYKAGGDVNAAQDMTVVIFPSTDFIYSVPS